LKEVLIQKRVSTDFAGREKDQEVRETFSESGVTLGLLAPDIQSGFEGFLGL
jgi:hypothetical protein